MQQEVYTEKSLQEINQAYQDMLSTVKTEIKHEDRVLLDRAFDIAVKAHRFQSRKSGEPYIFHPIAVARIVSEEMGLGPISIASALIHDVVEDSEEYALVDIEINFGKKIASIIDGLTKIPKIKGEDVSNQAKNFRKIIMTLADDPRVVFIKLADRLHNMRTMGAQKPASQKRISLITQYVFIPLAHRMGLYGIKSELEDLCLKYVEPDIYNEIKEKLQESKKERQEYLENFMASIRPILDSKGLKATIKGRPKTISGIYQKMQRQSVDFDHVFDKLAIRIIIDQENSAEMYTNDYRLACFVALACVTDLYKPSGVRLRNFIDLPKSNGYQSLHETVIGPENKWVEVQIRTIEMDEIAERGLASHWQYKEVQSTGKGGKNNKSAKSMNLWYEKIREHLESPEKNDAEFLDEIKLSLYLKEIAVYSPKGDVVFLPKGASVLDFAFEIHSELGKQCKGGLVNGRIVSFRHKLKNGDVVEILKSPKQVPRKDWLNLVITSKARNAIKQSLNAEKKQIAELGKEILQRKMKSLKLDFSDSVLQEMQQFFGVKTSQDIFYKVGTEEIDSQALRKFKDSRSNALMKFIKSRFKSQTSNPKPDLDSSKFQKPILVFDKAHTKMEYTLSPCCNPVPGDEVFGVTTALDGIKVHRYSCPNAKNIQARIPHRIKMAEWIEGAFDKFKCQLELSGIDEDGIVNHVTEVIIRSKSIALHRINIQGEDGVFSGKLTVEVPSLGVLQGLIEDLKQIEGVKNVIRKKA